MPRHASPKIRGAKRPVGVREVADDVSPGREFLGGLERGLQVLVSFNAQQRQMTLADIARAVSLPRATVRRAVLTLKHLGFVEGDERLFRLTPKVLRLASAYAESNQVTTILQPACQSLSKEFDEDCSAAVLDGAEVVRVAHASPPRLISMVPGIGFRLPAYCSALGRALLSGLQDREVKDKLAGAKLAALTPHTLTDPAAILAEVRAVRANGYSLVDREAEIGFRSIAVPVLNARGVVAAAINIGVRVETVTPARMRQVYLPRLREAAETLRHQLL